MRGKIVLDKFYSLQLLPALQVARQKQGQESLYPAEVAGNLPSSGLLHSKTET